MGKNKPASKPVRFYDNESKAKSKDSSKEAIRKERKEIIRQVDQFFRDNELG